MTTTTDAAALIAEARKLVEAATPGPWEARLNTCFWEFGAAGDVHTLGDTCASGSVDNDLDVGGSNAALIAAAPLLITRLAAALEAASAREGRLSEALEWYAKDTTAMGDRARAALGGAGHD
jgi:hypothetical protein